MSIVAQNGAPGGAGLLGYLAFMSIGDMKVHKQDLENMFNNAGLSLQKYQPGDIRPTDAFRRATSLLKNKRVDIQFNGQQRAAVLDITEFGTDDEIIRYIGRKVVDDKNKKLDYQNVTMLHFDRANNNVFFDAIDPVLLQETQYDQMLTQTVNVFTDWCQFHTKDTVRNIMNKVVNSLQPVPVAAIPGEPSVAKFIPVTYSNELEGMRRVVGDLAPHHLGSANSAVQYIELFESNANKVMINAALHGDVKAKVQGLVVELQEMLKKNGSVTVDTGKRLARDLQKIRSEVSTYESLLGASMDILEKQIATALMKVDEAPRAATKDTSGNP